MKVQRANVSLPLSLAHLSPGSPTTPKRSARINFWISGIYFVYTLFVYIFELFTFYFVYIFRGQSEADSRCHEVRPIPAAQLRQAHLQPTSASAPSSPRYTYIFILFCLLSLMYVFVYIIVCLLFIHIRLGLRRPPQQITVTSSATLKVTNNNQNNPPNRGATTRDRSKSPAVNR